MRDPEIVAYSPDYNTQMLYFTCSSLIEDDSYLFEISDRGGHPNVWVRNLNSSTVCQLSDNRASYQKSYVYFDGEPSKGLAKASVALDSAHGIVYYIQDNVVYQADRNGIRKTLSKIENGEMTAFCHVSSDGLRICVPTVDGRALDFDPQTEGTGLDKRPAYNIDERIQKEHLCSYLNVFSTETGVLLFRQRIPNAWITHVQFCPTNNNLIMFNNEWPYRDCGIRRIWLSDGERFWQVRKEGGGRSRKDWVCHEMWTSDGSAIIYHGAYQNGPAFVGRIRLSDGLCQEIPLPNEYNAYGHFNISKRGTLVCDGYFKMPHDKETVRENSTDNGPDPHKKIAKYICQIQADWEKKTLSWIPLCKHETDWLGQDSHPHPIFDHAGRYIYFSSRREKTIGIYRILTQQGGV